MIGGHGVIALAYEDWARDNLLRAFVFTWAGVVLLWLILDWLGNPNRGRFRPQGPRRVRGIRGRFWAWRDNRDSRDAEIRETLRAAYGKSSLRLGWSTFDETSATAHDEARLAPVPQLLELGAESAAPPPTLETAMIDVLWGDDELTDVTTGPGTAEPDDELIDLTTAAVAPQPMLETAEIDILWGDDELIDLTTSAAAEPGTAEADDELIDLTTAAQTELFTIADLATGPDHAVIDLTTGAAAEPGTAEADDELIDLTAVAAAKPGTAETDDELIDLTTVAAAKPEGLFGTDTAVIVAETAPPEVKVGWQLGEDPRALTLAGVTPSRTTIRSRAWKNHAAALEAVGRENRRRMTKGRPPRRWNPITGRRETARIDLDEDSFTVTWSTAGIDPYAHGPNLDRTPT